MPRFLFSLAACLLLASSPAHSQENGTTERNLRSLTTIAEPIHGALANLETLQTDLEQAASDDARREIQHRIDQERETIRQLRDNFRSTLGGSEAAEYDNSSPETTGIQEQITEIVQPILTEIREATSKPRELDSLRNSLANWQNRKLKTDAVLERIDSLILLSEQPALTAELQSARRIWAGRQAEANTQTAILQAQIEARTANQQSIWENLSKVFSNFFKSRGMNLIYAILVGVIGYIATRKIYSSARRLIPLKKKDDANITSCISDVLAVLLAVLVSLFGIILVFYVRGDWLLLTLVLIFLVGLAWAGKTALPPYLEQIRMILNIGAVREGERIIYQGVPWKVSSIGFFTHFHNPHLHGGHLRIPIRHIMDMVSRPPDPKEKWFPTEADDWVILSDETYGKIISQSPEQVIVLLIGGSLKTYPTPEFLELHPLNLSHGFRISETFGIDYQHQAGSTTTIPETLTNTIESSLTKEFTREAVRSIKVEFSTAAASSLDYTILADFDGTLASKYRTLQRRIQSTCVDACNENGWIIPFTQITIHNQPEN